MLYFPGRRLLQISRVRSRASEVRVNMGLACEVEVLRPEVGSRLTGNGCTPVKACAWPITHPSRWTGRAFLHGEVQNSMSDIGRRFRLDPGNRKLRVTNLPEKARKGDMLLTPGLAPGAVLEVSFFQRHQFRLAGSGGGLHASAAQWPACSGKGFLRDGDVVHLNAYHALRCRFSAGVLDEEYHAIRTLSVEGVTKIPALRTRAGQY